MSESRVLRWVVSLCAGGLLAVAVLAGPARAYHSSDYNPADWKVGLSELLRGIQFYNSGSYGCGSGTEDGYAPASGDRTCAPHNADYNPQDWKVSLSELLRLIQFYNLGGCYEDPASEDGFSPQPAGYRIGPSRYLQHREHENPASNPFLAWVPVTKAGTPVAQEEVSGVRLLDGAGAEVTPVAPPSYYPLNAIVYDCETLPCSAPATEVMAGFVLRFGALLAGTYTMEVDASDGSTASETVVYDGQLVLPHVESATMQAQWQGTDLVLTWANPVADPGWSDVDRVRLFFWDGAGKDVLEVPVSLEAANVRVPADVLNAAAALGDGTVAQWEVQTRALDSRGMNDARGYSSRAAVPPSPFDTFAIAAGRYLQYREYEDPASNRFQGWVPVTKNGASASQADLRGMRLLDGSGTEVAPLSPPGFLRLTYLYYNCATGSCVKSGPFSESGYGPRYGALPAGTYTMEVDTAGGQTLSETVVYDGQLVLPPVESATMQAQWQGTDLVLSWTNPTGDPAWGEVTQERVVLFDGAGKDVLYVRPALTTPEVRLPQALLAEAAALGDGTLVQWQIQTRALDTRSMNHARGYSALVALP